VAATSLAAGAQNRTIIEERPVIAVPLPVPGIEVERRERVERREVETTGRGGCDSKTVRKEGPEGSKTVTKERCDLRSLFWNPKRPADHSTGVLLWGATALNVKRLLPPRQNRGPSMGGWHSRSAGAVCCGA
jgi:hypothetical protein